MSQLLIRGGFSIRNDLCYPTTQRVISVLSGVINFVKFCYGTPEVLHYLDLHNKIVGYFVLFVDM